MTFEERLEIKKSFFELQKIYKTGKRELYIKEAKKYLELNPKDYGTRYRYAKTLRYMKKYEEAIQELKYILKYDRTNGEVISFLYFTYYHLGNYSEAYKLLPMVLLYSNCNRTSIYLTKMVIKKNLNIDFEETDEIDDKYIKRQIINYNNEDALTIIQNHFKSCSEQNSKNATQFNDIDLDYLIDVVKENLILENKTIGMDVMDIYYFKIYGIGQSEFDTCSVLKVVVVPFTKDIVEMYPTSGSYTNQALPLDIDYDKLFKRENKVKKMSRIDKFNKRYNRE